MEPLDGVSRFPVFPDIQIISELLKFLLIPISLFQALCHLLLVLPRNIFQDRPSAMDLTHLPECTEEGGFGRLLDAHMTLGDDQMDPENDFKSILI